MYSRPMIQLIRYWNCQRQMIASTPARLFLLQPLSCVPSSFFRAILYLSCGQGSVIAPSKLVCPSAMHEVCSAFRRPSSAWAYFPLFRYSTHLNWYFIVCYEYMSSRVYSLHVRRCLPYFEMSLES